jgi:hypothetical protein
MAGFKMSDARCSVEEEDVVDCVRRGGRGDRRKTDGWYCESSYGVSVIILLCRSKIIS